MDLLESQNAKDARVEQLWRQLDVSHKGELDLQDLRKGLKKIDHPLKNAHGLLGEVMKAVDKNGDGKIQYEEFRIFVEQTETELFRLFQSIDRDRDGKLDKAELQAAFKRAGLSVPQMKLDRFFSEVDSDRDGAISFEEWRNFLLFLPADSPGLQAVLSYYTSTVTLNPEGDPVLSDETVEGLGRPPTFLNSLFGSIFSIASPRSTSSTSQGGAQTGLTGSTDASEQVSPTASSPTTMHDAAQDHFRGQSDTPKAAVSLEVATHGEAQWNEEHAEPEFSEDVDVSKPVQENSLTGLLPDPGYFAAGGIAGAVSRTATAPLDRLKVYLIANTGSGVVKDSLSAVQKGDAVAAAKYVGRPLIEATKELWRAGGIRSLFAGNGLNVLKVMPESAIKFGSYEGAKRALAHIEGHRDSQNINPYSKFVAGGVGGMVSQLCVYPLDTLKFRMQSNVQAGGLEGNALILETAKKMYRDGGLRSAYRGLTMGLVGMFPYSAIDLGTFEFIKGRVRNYNSRVLKLPPDDPACSPGSFTTGAIGAFSGAFGASMVYPINLLRTRLQVQGTVLHPQTYDGVVDCARRTIKNEGFPGLFKGITPNLLKVVPAVSITYVVYENAKKAFHLR